MALRIEGAASGARTYGYKSEGPTYPRLLFGFPWLANPKDRGTFKAFQLASLIYVFAWPTDREQNFCCSQLLFQCTDPYLQRCLHKQFVSCIYYLCILRMLRCTFTLPRQTMAIVINYMPRDRSDWIVSYQMGIIIKTEGGRLYGRRTVAPTLTHTHTDILIYILTTTNETAVCYCVINLCALFVWEYSFLLLLFMALKVRKLTGINWWSARSWSAVLVLLVDWEMENRKWEIVNEAEWRVHISIWFNDLLRGSFYLLYYALLRIFRNSLFSLAVCLPALGVSFSFAFSAFGCYCCS